MHRSVRSDGRLCPRPWSTFGALKSSGHFLHGPDSGRWQHTPFRLEMTDHVFHDLTQLGVKPDRVVTVNPRDNVRALAHVSLVLVTPLNPFVVLIACSHCCTRSIARRTCFS